MAVSDYLLEIKGPDLKGESQDDQFKESIHIMARALRGAAPCVFAGGGRLAGWIFEFMMAGQMHHLDAVGIEAFIVDQSFGQRHRLRRAVRLDIDLTLQTLEAMSVRIQKILVEGDAIAIH